MNKSHGDLQNEVKAYKEKLKEYESKIREKQDEREIERAKPPKNRKRSLGKIWNEIKELNDEIWRLRPKKNCPNCNTELNYDSILCWKCGEVFLDVCPKCKSLSVSLDEWASLKCADCGFECAKSTLFEELLIGCADPNYPYFRIINPREVLGLNCYNIGKRNNTIWDLCKDYNCPFEEKCEYYCPAFLSVLGLVWRGKVSIGLPWGYDQGGDLHGYKIRWKRPRRQEE